jgi:multicomponent Na+:H+ antiporter subunit G
MAQQLVTLIDLVRFAVGGVFVVIGLAIMAGGMLGILRFPDFYTRLHAQNASSSVGAVLLTIGLAAAAPDWRIALKLVVLGVLVAAVAPAVAHFAANAAHAAGLAPIAGAYRAPRPGEPRRDFSS